MSASHSKNNQFSLSLAAIGVVFGDIGTSPLYAVKEVFSNHIPLDNIHILGVLSLMFWALVLVVTIKYATFIMRANNKGEGGIMALMTLALQSVKEKPKQRTFIITIGLFGAALFYGDGIITPAISVLSAVEGLQIISPSLSHYVLPIAVIVLTLLFILQAKGTGTVGKLFSPIMCLWFICLAGLGIRNLVHAPQVLAAINPYYGLHLLVELGWQGFLIMGSVVLAITGAEALYADMGHFGLKPIRYAWFSFVFPALLLNYFGQGALLLNNPAAVENPFYLLAPNWAMYPLLILATLASVIASQAVISGAFSVTRQAIQLGYCSRMKILHTSSKEMGQVYLPLVNWLLMLSVFIVVLSFQSSSALASAYGIAVTGTMIIDTSLAFIVIRKLWQWPVASCYLFLGVFVTTDCLFLFANSLKIPTGGWLPLVIGAVLFLIMSTWLQGRALVTGYMNNNRLSFEDFLDKLKDASINKVKGTAIYLTRSLHGVPQVFSHNFAHNHVLHEQIIVLTIVIKEEPYIDEAHRIKIRKFGNDIHPFYRIKFYYGFQQDPDVKRDLELCHLAGINLNNGQTSFFLGSESVAFKRRNPFPKWRRVLFLFLMRNAASPIDFFKIPPKQVVELGLQIEL